MCLHLLWSYYWNWISIIRVYEKNVMFIPLSDVLFYKVFFNRGIKMCQTLDRWNIPLTKYNKTANLWCQKSLHFKMLQTEMDSNKAIGNINSVTKNKKAWNRITQQKAWKRCCFDENSTVCVAPIDVSMCVGAHIPHTTWW